EQLDGALWVSAFLMRYHSTGGQWAKLDDPLTTITTKDRLALVTVWISGSPYVIVDIRLRMLKPRELYRAQGFPDSYIIERGHNGQRFTLSQQVHMCGNSVSPNTMAAYARANDPWKRRLRPSPQQVAA
ncbi:DNA cytosine methyltransferase, partial [Pseudomonas aeruginosa]